MIPYSAHTETGTQLPIIAQAKVESHRRTLMMTTAQEFESRRWIALALLCFAIACLLQTAGASAAP